MDRWAYGVLVKMEEELLVLLRVERVLHLDRLAVFHSAHCQVFVQKPPLSAPIGVEHIKPSFVSIVLCSSHGNDAKDLSCRTKMTAKDIHVISLPKVPRAQEQGKRQGR